MAESDLIKQAGWFDERLKYTLDYEICSRLTLHMYYLDEVLVLYWVHSIMVTAKYREGMVKKPEYIQSKFQQFFKLLRKKLIKYKNHQSSVEH